MVGWGEVVVVAWGDETEVTVSGGGTAALVEMVGATLVGICDAGAGCVVATVNGTVGSAAPSVEVAVYAAAVLGDVGSSVGDVTCAVEVQQASRSTAMLSDARPRHDLARCPVRNVDVVVVSGRRIIWTAEATVPREARPQIARVTLWWLLRLVQSHRVGSVRIRAAKRRSEQHASLGHAASLVALLPGRTRFIAMHRPALRFAQVISVADPGDRRRWAKRGLLGVAIDLGWTALLKRTDSEMLGSRLVSDVADVAMWAGCDPSSAAAAILMNAPLTTEISVRRNPKQSALAAGVVVMVALIRRRRKGLVINPFDLVWAMIGPATGLVWRWNERAEISRVRAFYADEVAARVGGARLSGQREVAMDADSVIDLLCRTIPLIDPHNAGVVLRGPLAVWKAEVAQATRTSGATFLGDLLLRWQTARNTNPDVSTWVWPNIEEDLGTVLLHPLQADQLWSALQTTDLVGHITIAVPDIEQARQHDSLKIIVAGTETITLTAPEQRRSTWKIEPTPVALILGALWVLVTADKKRYAVPPPIVALGVAAYVAAAAATQKSLQRDRTTGRKRAVRAVSTLSVGFAAIATVSSRNANVTGSQIAATAGANTLGLIAGIWSPELDNDDRRVLIGAASATLAAAWLLNPKTRSASRFASELIWPLIAREVTRTVPQILRMHADAIIATLEQQADGAVDTAANDGRNDARRIVTDVVVAARRLLETNRPRLDPRLIAEATARIETCERETATWITSETNR